MLLHPTSALAEEASPPIDIASPRKPDPHLADVPHPSPSPTASLLPQPASPQSRWLDLSERSPDALGEFGAHVELLAAIRSHSIAAVSSALSIEQSGRRECRRSVLQAAAVSRLAWKDAQQQLAELEGRLTETRATVNLAVTCQGRQVAVNSALAAATQRRLGRIAEEMESLSAASNHLSFSFARVEPLLNGMQARLTSVVESIVTANEEEVNNVLIELSEGHLPKPYDIDESQLTQPHWGDSHGWSAVERAVRVSFTLVDEGAGPGSSSSSPSGKRASLLSKLGSPLNSAGDSVLPPLIGPFHLVEQRDARLVRVKRQPFSEGAMRIAYLCEDVSDVQAGQFDGAVRLVAKESKFMGVHKRTGQQENRRSFYVGDVMAQMVAAELVERFNQLNPPKLVAMLAPMLYEFPERDDHERRYMAAELSLTGLGEEFARYTNNESEQNDHFRTMMALSHWSFDHTHGRLMLCDLQGVRYVLTDPQIHSNLSSNSHHLFGQGDLGESGMDSFFEQHVCNELCHKFRLQRHPKQPDGLSGQVNTKGETKVGADYVSDVIGVCGHIFQLGVKRRKEFIKKRQRLLCDKCANAKGQTTRKFFFQD